MATHLVCQTVVQASHWEESADAPWRGDSWDDLTSFLPHSVFLGFGDRWARTHCVRAGIVDVCFNMKMQLPTTTSAEPMEIHPWTVLSV